MIHYPLLLSPLRIGPFEVRNRVVSTAHGAFLDFYRPGEPATRYVTYQERRAAGGAGLIILQPVHVHESSQALGHHLYEPGDLGPKLRQLADAVHRHGTPVFLQLIHFGAEFRSDARTDLQPLWSFSGHPSPTGAEPSHAMSGEEIEAVIDGFARTATLAVESGLDGVELHAAHGYLVQQSFSPWANRRDDEWGDPLRFVTELMRRVRAAIGPDRVMGIRISVDDYRNPERGGLGPAGLRETARRIIEIGLVDYLNTSAGSRAAHYATAVGSYRHPHGELLPLVSAMREAVGAAVPVVGAGRITTPELAEQALADAVCDLVAMTRAQIADPDLVVKLVRDERARLRPCVGANQGCVDRMIAALPITCFHNPDVGREHRLGEPPPAAEPRRVVVIGGGPAGLKAAEVAARRGHRVTLFERAGELGGRLRLVDASAHELLGSISWLQGELERLGVECRTGIEATPELLAAELPEAIVLAPGARPGRELGIPGDGSVPVVSLDEAMTGSWVGARAIVIDHLGTAEVAMAAERLAREGSDVVLLTPAQAPCANLGFTQVKDQLERLYELGCEVLVSTTVAELSHRSCVLRHVHSGRRERRSVDVLVAGVAGEPELGLYAAAHRVSSQVLLAGDVVAPRSAMHAFREGDAAARAI